MQAAELSDAEVEAELSRPGRVQEVLPLVWPAHAAPGDPLVPTVDGKADASRAPRAARAAGAGPRRGATFASPRALDDERRSRAEPSGRRPAARRRGAAARLGADQLHPGVDRPAQEGRVAEPEGEHQRNSGRADRVRHRRPLPLAERRALEVRRAAPAAAIERIECFAGMYSTPT